MAVEGACSLTLDEEQLASAAEEVACRGIRPLPTETVYGVGVAVNACLDWGVLPGSETGYGRIFTLLSVETPPRPCHGWSTVPMPWTGMGRRFPMLFARLPRSAAWSVDLGGARRCLCAAFYARGGWDGRAARLCFPRDPRPDTCNRLAPRRDLGEHTRVSRSCIVCRGRVQDSRRRRFGGRCG